MIYANIHKTDIPIKTHDIFPIDTSPCVDDFSPPSFPSNVSTSTSNNCANLIKLSEFGFEVLVSHLVTA